MALARVRITALRCLTQVELALDTRRNFIFGPNGAGKTSILEGVFLLGRGRSFRTRQTRRLVQRGQDGFAVFGEVPGNAGHRRLGVSFTAGHLTKRIDGQDATGMAALAEILPVHSLDPSSHQLVEGAPSERRRFLDWGVFHVEHAYLDSWKRYRRILSQRNAALKAGATATALRSWTMALLESGAAVDASRRSYVSLLAPLVTEFGQQLLDQPLSIEYRPGWVKGQTFEAGVAAAERRDLMSRTTEVGPHRADLEIQLAGRRLQDEASRGQQKLAAAAMVLAQLAVGSTQQASPVLLVDDPAAELDALSLGRLLDLLERVPAQIVLTALSAEHLSPIPGYPVFHVEQGAVRGV
ncbi:MAG: DNA replication/repair protein RecF [Gammaproteobacteria bacterium]